MGVVSDPQGNTKIFLQNFFILKGCTMKEYDPQSMIDSINKSNNDMKFTTAGDYMRDVEEHKPTGGETWQTKATAKGAVPKYYSPTELLSMRVDKLEEMVKNLNTRLSNITSEHLTPIKDEDL